MHPQRRTIAIVGYGTAGQALADPVFHAIITTCTSSNGPPRPVRWAPGSCCSPAAWTCCGRWACCRRCLRTAPRCAGCMAKRRAAAPVMDMRYARAGCAPARRGHAARRVVLAAGRRRGRSRATCSAGTTIVEVDAEQGRVRDAAGRWHGPYDLVIAADGAASTLRNQVQATHAGSRIPVGRAVVPGAARRLAVRR